MKKVFFLGGYDLEMLTIKELFDVNKIPYEDKHLKWGAKLSDYKEHFDTYTDYTIYGIELEQNITPPIHYIEIDHHGKNDDNPSSLEQIATILKLELSKEQKLISANDSRYISGMKNLCATQEEINEIRTKDRKAQGITQEDEDLAQESISQIDSNIIYSKTSHFSAVSDIAYYKFDNYTIHNDNKIVFYGYKRSDILEFLKTQNITETAYYYGGGEFGFVGIKDDILQKEQVQSLINIFQEYKKEEVYSYHTFMLPFTFKNDFIESDKWNHKPFKVNTQENYNEYIYFYKHIQDALYEGSEENFISQYYEHKKQHGTYTINCKKGEFKLELDGLSLRIFNTNIGILAFNLKNTKYSQLDDILAINDFGRRIYPQFLGNEYTKNTKDAFLAKCITLHLKDEEPIIENFTTFDTLNFEKLDAMQLLPKFVRELIDSSFKQPNTIRPIIDDRMFVISWYGNNAFSQSLRCEQYITNPKWYEYVFVDGDGITIHSKKMQTELINQSTYDRWMDHPYGCTLYGVSRYSFVSITNESDFAKNTILTHMKTMYFQMFTLLLAYRATIIKFANGIQEITKKDDKELFDEAKQLYHKYLQFLNKLYFKEITAQDQGIELYNQAMKIMDIEKYMSDLDNEMNELHNYVNMIEDKKRTNSIDKISKMGSYLLAPALVTGFFGMNIIDFEEIAEQCQLCYGVGVIIVIIISGFLMPVILNKKEQK